MLIKNPSYSGLKIGFGYWALAPVWLKLQQILTDLQTAVTQVLDEQWRIQKKGKSSEFDAEDDDYIKSGPAVKV